MSIEAEFIVNLGPYEHVKLTFKVDGVDDLFADMGWLDEGRREALGDYHASLKAAILYGRDRALNAVRQAGETIKEDDSREAQEDPVELLKEELGATVLEVREEPVEAPSSPSTGRPWSKKPAAKKVKEWEKAPAEEPEPSKVKKNAAAASEWDF